MIDDKSTLHPKLSSVAIGFVSLLRELAQDSVYFPLEEDRHVASSASIYLLSPRLQINQSIASFIFLRIQIQRIKSRKANPAAAQGTIKDSI